MNRSSSTDSDSKRLFKLYTMTDAEAEEKSAVTYVPIEVVNLGADIVFKLSADEAEAAEISTAGALREHEPFR